MTYSLDYWTGSVRSGGRLHTAQWTPATGVLLYSLPAGVGVSSATARIGIDAATFGGSDSVTVEVFATDGQGTVTATGKTCTYHKTDFTSGGVATTHDCEAGI